MKKSEKAAYVKKHSNQDGKHGCHWIGCKKKCPPAMWGCKEHWFKLPKKLRDKIWATYMPGQEINKNPSEEYLAVADEVRDWIKANDVRTPKKKDRMLCTCGNLTRRDICGKCKRPLR